MNRIKPAEIIFRDDGKIECPAFDDIYFSSPEEAEHVFIKHNHLPERFAALKDGDIFRIGELGFGTGLNFFLTQDLWLKMAPENARLEFISMEKYPLHPADFSRIDYTKSLQGLYPPIVPGIHSIPIENGRIMLRLYFEDVSYALRDLNTQIDAWFLDGFTPRTNDAMWDENIYPELARLSHRETSFATFTAAGRVRRGMESAGFNVEKVGGYGHKRDMLRGTYKTGEKHIPAKKPVTIMGAGIAGCSLAHTLSRRGFEVRILDKRPGPMQAASGNPVGVVYPKLGVAWSVNTQLNLTAFLNLWRYLKTSGAKAGFNPCGVMTLDMDDKAKEKHDRQCTELGLPGDILRRITQHEATEIAGVPLPGGGVFRETGGTIHPRELGQSLLDQSRNIQIEYNTEYSGHEGILIYAGGIETAAGLPLETVEGQMTYLPATQTSQNLKCVINHKGTLMPAQAGVHYVGATFKRGADMTYKVTPDAHAENLEKLQQNLPGVFEALPGLTDLEGRVGYRAATPDRLPLIGRVPKQEDTYILGGLGSHGHTTALTGADIITGQLTGDAMPLTRDVLKALNPARYG